MKVLIFGGHGYLGTRLSAAYGDDAVCPVVDILDMHAVAKTLDKYKPDIVINAAGKTGRPNVDWCEANKPQTIHSNVAGPLVLLEECLRRNIYLVQLSTGCIYQGDNGGKGFTEIDKPNFSGSFYARTKIHLECLLAEFPVLTLRLRMPFDGSLHERNLIVKLTKYDKIIDSLNSITSLDEFIAATKLLISKRKTGLYNITNPGLTSPFRVMSMYRDIVDPMHKFCLFSESQLQAVTIAARSSCQLNTDKLANEGIVLRHVDLALEDCLRQMSSQRRLKTA